MKRILMLAIVTMVLFSGINNSFGKGYWRTYEVIEITDNGLRITGSNDVTLEVNKDPKGYKVGYKVRYDRVRNILKIDPWQDYTVINVSAMSLTLRHEPDGEELKLESGYRGKYKEGDRVSYDSVRKNLKMAEDFDK